MFPTFTVYDQRNRCLRYGKSICEAFKALAAGSYRQNVGRCEFGESGLFSFHVSALIDRIADIVRYCSKKEMVRAAARWVVAFVKDAKVVWNCPEVNLPRKPMRRKLFHPISDDTVAFSVKCAFPSPTILTDYDVRPKAFFKSWPRSIERRTTPRATWLSVRFVKSGWNDLKLITAGRTLATHTIDFLFDCLPRLRLFVQRAGNFVSRYQPTQESPT